MNPKSGTRQGRRRLETHRRRPGKSYGRRHCFQGIVRLPRSLPCRSAGRAVLRKIFQPPYTVAAFYRGPAACRSCTAWNRAYSIGHVVGYAISQVDLNQSSGRNPVRASSRGERSVLARETDKPWATHLGFTICAERCIFGLALTTGLLPQTVGIMARGG